MLCWSASPGSQWCPRWFSEGTSHYQAWRTWGEAWPVRCPGISSQLLCWKYQKVKNTKEMHKTHSMVTVCNIYPHYWTQTPSLQTGKKQTHSMVIAYSQTWPMTGASAMECSTLRPHWPSGKKNTLTLLSHLRNKNLQSVGLLGYISFFILGGTFILFLLFALCFPNPWLLCDIFSCTAATDKHCTG